MILSLNSFFLFSGCEDVRLLLCIRVCTNYHNHIKGNYKCLFIQYMF